MTIFVGGRTLRSAAPRRGGSRLVLPEPPRSQHLMGMGRGGVVKDGMPDQDQQLVVASAETSGQWLVAGLDDHSFPNHLPELLLRDPEFLAVITHDQCRLFYSHSRSLVFSGLF